MFFTFVSRFHKVRGEILKFGVFRTVFTYEILFLVIKFVLNKINLDLTQYKIEYYVIFVALLH